MARVGNKLEKAFVSRGLTHKYFLAFQACVCCACVEAVEFNRSYELAHIINN